MSSVPLHGADDADDCHRQLLSATLAPCKRTGNVRVTALKQLDLACRHLPHHELETLITIIIKITVNVAIYGMPRGVTLPLPEQGNMPTAKSVLAHLSLPNQDAQACPGPRTAGQ